MRRTQETKPASDRKPVPCRDCGAAETTVIDHRADRVLRHCEACKLSWTTDADVVDAPSAELRTQNSERRTKH